MTKSKVWVLAMCALLACGGSSTGGRRGKAVELPKASPKALKEFDAGMRALRLGGPEGAEKARTRLLSAAQLDGNLWEAWHNLGVLYLKQDNTRQAFDAFGKALAVNPNHLETRLARAEAARALADWKVAAADYQALIRERPTDRLAYARLASMHRDRKRFEDGLDVIREALRQAGADSTIYVELALIYLGQGRDELAELVLRRALDLDAKAPEVHNAIALVLLERGRDQQAFESFDRATSLDPGFTDARYNAASVLLDAGDYGRAEAKLGEIVSKDPDDFDAKVALGVALRGQKKFKRAQRVWEDVAQSAPPSSMSRGDALWNLAVLEADIKMEDVPAKRALDRYLQNSPRNHPKRKQAMERKKELGQ